MREPDFGWSYPPGCSGPPEPEIPEFDPCICCGLPFTDCECDEADLGVAYSEYSQHLRDEAADAAREEAWADQWEPEEPFFDDNIG